MQRFYVPHALKIDITLTDTNLIHQISRVMRSKIGDSIILFDGNGSEIIYSIISITKSSIGLRGYDQKFPQTEAPTTITLYQALPNKLEKIEYIIQKGVEVGIKKFIFFRSDHSQKLILNEPKKKRLITIAQEALEQCGGLKMPDIEFHDGSLLSKYQSKEGQEVGKHIVLDTSGNTQKIREIPQDQEISLWVGPEGGWSENERTKMQENGFLFVRFGERVLRTETAGIVVSFAFIHQ